MNVRASGMPFAEHPYGFGIVLFFTLVLTLIVAYIFNKKDLVLKSVKSVLKKEFLNGKIFQ